MTTTDEARDRLDALEARVDRVIDSLSRSIERIEAMSVEDREAFLAELRVAEVAILLTTPRTPEE